MFHRLHDPDPRRLRARRAAAALGLALLVAGGAGWAEDQVPPVQRGGVRTVSGSISSVDARARSITIEAPGGAVALSFDRNTAVLLEHRLGSVRDLSVGNPARASIQADGRAVWIEVLPPPAPSTTPGQGRALPRPAAGEPHGGSGSAGVPSGPPTPPPDAGHPAPRRPAPAGPGPVPGGPAR